MRICSALMVHVRHTDLLLIAAYDQQRLCQRSSEIVDVAGALTACRTAGMHVLGCIWDCIPITLHATS
jgi:hypothetical protein